MIRVLVVVIFLLHGLAAPAQLIVNVENSRIQSDTTGWKGDIGTSFSLTKNVQSLLSIGATLHLQYKTTRDMYLLLGNYNLLTSDQQLLVNNMFYHIRYNRKLGEGVRWEAFTQWQQNSVNNIDLRAVVGTGPRFTLHENEKFKIYAATLVMYEHETDKYPHVIHMDMRSDNYITFTFKPNNIFDATSTTFFQPLFKQFNDYRVLNQVVFNIKATKHFTISTNWDFSYDSFPPEGTPTVNYTITNGFSYIF